MAVAISARPVPSLRGRTYRVSSRRLITLQNFAEGGTNGTTVTTGNSGGLSGNAWDVVTIGSGATNAYDNLHAAHGNLSYKIATGATSVTSFNQWTTLSYGAPAVTTWYRMYLFFTANPAAAIRIAQFNALTTLGAAVRINATGTLSVLSSTGAAILTTTATIPLNQWFRIEGFVTGGPNQGQVEIKLFTQMDGTTPVETDTSAATQNTLSALDRGQFGLTAAAANVAAFWMDDLGLSNIGYLGPVTPKTAPSTGMPGSVPRQRLIANYPRAGTVSVQPVFGSGNIGTPVQGAGFGSGQGSGGGPVSNPTIGPPFTQFNHPVKAQNPLAGGTPGNGAIRGRVYSRGVSVPPLISSGPPFIQRPYAVQAQDPLVQAVPGARALRGRVYFNAGGPVRNPVQGPVFRQAVQPAKARLPVPLLKGRIVSNPGGPVLNPVLGPVFRQVSKVRAVIPRTWSKGRTYSNPGGPVNNPTVGPPPFWVLTQPAGFRIIFLRGGAAWSNPGGPVRNPTQGPVFRQVTQPARARVPQRVSGGRIRGNPGTPPPAPLPVGPPFIQAHQPVRARLPLLPLLRGRSGSNAGGALRNPTSGPVFLQAVHPVRPVIPQVFSKGRISSNPGGPVNNPVQGPVFRQAVSPPRIRIVLPRSGRATGNPGGPVRNPLPPSLPPVPVTRMFATGRIMWNLGAPPGPLSGPPFRQATQPARAKLPVPFLKGRTSSNPGAPVQNPPVIVRQFATGRIMWNLGIPVPPPPPPPPVGPPFFPRLNPARSQIPQNAPRGRVYFNPGGLVRNPVQGPKFVQAVQPARVRIRQNAPRGRTSGNNGGPVRNPLHPAIMVLGLPYTRWVPGQSYTRWQTVVTV